MSSETSTSLQPWQFFVLAALGCATAVTFISRGQGITTVLLLTVLMGAAAFVGMTVLRMLKPLVSAAGRSDRHGRSAHAGRARTRKDARAEIDQGTRVRSSDGEAVRRDWAEMSGRLRAQRRAS